MEELEKMTALKKAYAEIILNTAKEAAARIMVSERRVHQVHHDLSSTKDEALRLLLRLKQNMDSKLNEAEMKSLHQQRRIEELEAQLQEAEDIVSNLRAELNEAHMKMEEMEKSQTHNWRNMMEKAACEDEMAEPVLASQVNGLSNAANGDSIAIDSLEENGYVSVPDVTRRKITELYRNGCTQRIHAYEGNLLNGHLPLAGKLDDMKDEKTMREDQEGERIYTNPLIGADITHIVGKELVNVKETKNVDITSCKGQVCKSFRKKRKAATRYRRTSTSLQKFLPPVAKEARSDLPNSQTCLPGSHEMLESLNDKDKSTQSVLPSTSPLNVSDMGALPEHVAGVQGDDEVAEAHTNAMDEDREVASSLVLIRQQSGSVDCLEVPHSNPELEMKNVSSTILDAKVLNSGEGFLYPPQKNRVLKYTFQRKRKREALSSDDSSLLSQENPVKRKTGKKQNSSPEPLKSSTAAESSRDSRRMAQVARQLISLSEKKWWK